MTAKQYLTKVDMLDRMIKNKLSEIYQLKTMACSITVSNDGDLYGRTLRVSLLDFIRPELSRIHISEPTRPY